MTKIHGKLRESFQILFSNPTTKKLTRESYSMHFKKIPRFQGFCNLKRRRCFNFVSICVCKVQTNERIEHENWFKQICFYIINCRVSWEQYFSLLSANTCPYIIYLMSAKPRYSSTSRRTWRAYCIYKIWKIQQF